MDSQHDDCVKALNDLMHRLSVQALRIARDELAKHFDDEERLLKKSGFAQRGVDTCGDGANDFSALGTHIADHQRIVKIANDALVSLEAACEASEGAVPKKVAVGLCKAFVEHASMYDALYVGKLDPQFA